MSRCVFCGGCDRPDSGMNYMDRVVSVGGGGGGAEWGEGRSSVINTVGLGWDTGWDQGDAF